MPRPTVPLLSLLLSFGFWNVDAADKGLITDLPGLTFKPTFKQYSGYIQTPDPYYKKGSVRNLHYWFVESARDPAKDPVVLWLTGGPGCSSELAFITENGPFTFTNTSMGIKLTANPYSWNTVANVLWLDAPSGVGFSYGGNYTTGDHRTSEFNYIFLKGFFERFPEFAQHEFYITGESYAGHYVPELAYKIVTMNPKAKQKINFKGYMVGNPSGINSREFKYSYWTFMHQKGFISDTEYTAIAKQCESGRNPNCRAAGDKLWNQNLRGINPYDVYSTCVGQGAGGHFACLTSELDAAIEEGDEEYLSNFVNVPVSGSQTFVPCMNLNNSVHYLRQADVRKALHIPKEAFQWEPCSHHINYTQFDRNTKQLYHDMVGKLRIIVYSGDVDSCVPWLMTSHGVESLGYKPTKPYRRWMYKQRSAGNTEQIGGYVQEYEGITYATVRGAGHMVPTFKPEAALGLLEKFLFNQPW